jgi:hypothetical protein
MVYFLAGYLILSAVAQARDLFLENSGEVRVRSLLAGFNTTLIVNKTNTIWINKQVKGIPFVFQGSCAIISPYDFR